MGRHAEAAEQIRRGEEEEEDEEEDDDDMLHSLLWEIQQAGALFKEMFKLTVESHMKWNILCFKQQMFPCC